MSSSGTFLPMTGSVAEVGEVHLHLLHKITCKSQQRLERDETGKKSELSQKNCNKGFARLMVKTGWKPRLLVHQRSSLLNVNKNKNTFLSKWDGKQYFSKFLELLSIPETDILFCLFC